MWQQFSNNDAIKAAKTNNTAIEPVDNQIRFQPLPTLIPVQITGFTGGTGTLADQNIGSAGLRQVTAPTLQPRTQAPITLQQVIINSPGASANSGVVIPDRIFSLMESKSFRAMGCQMSAFIDSPSNLCTRNIGSSTRMV